MAKTMDQFIRDLDKGVKGSFTKKAMTAWGLFAIATIVGRSREGRGVSRTGGRERNFLPLSDPPPPKSSYVRYRERNRHLLHKSTTPRKSNITFTGKMLDSMKIKEVTRNRVTWGPGNQRRKGGVTNAQIAEYLADGGRPFNFLSKKDIDKLVKVVDKAIQRKLRRV